MRLLLIGGGGHCLSCISVIETLGSYSVVGVVEREPSGSAVSHGYPVLGTDDDLEHLLPLTDEVLITVGQITDSAPRKHLFNRLRGLGARFATISAADANVSCRASLGDGSVVLSGSTVNAGARIGRNCIINSHALIEHGVEVDDHCHVSTGVLVNGDVVIGAESFIGSGAIIREGVVIGAKSVIGAGSRIGRDVPPGAKVESNWAHQL